MNPTASIPDFSEPRALRWHFWGTPSALDWHKLLGELQSQQLVEPVYPQGHGQSQEQGQGEALDLGAMAAELTKRGIGDVAPLGVAGGQDAAFALNLKWLRRYEECAPGLLFVAKGFLRKAEEFFANRQARDAMPAPLLLASGFPQVALGRMTEALYPDAVEGWDATSFCGTGQSGDGIAPTAFVHESAILGRGVVVGPGGCVGAGAVLGDNVRVMPGATIGAKVVLGARCCVGPGARLMALVAGDDCKFRANCVVGERGYGVCAAPAIHSGQDRHALYNVPQIAGVRMGERVEMRHMAVVDRGALEDTVLGDDVHVDSHSTVGHGAYIGDRTSLGNCVGIGGNARVDNDCILWSYATVQEGVHLGPNSELKYLSAHHRDLPEGNKQLFGIPAIDVREHFRRKTYFDKMFQNRKNGSHE